VKGFCWVKGYSWVKGYLFVFVLHSAVRANVIDRQRDLFYHFFHLYQEKDELVFVEELKVLGLHGEDLRYWAFQIDLFYYLEYWVACSS
jgi:hypothetical protein